MMPLTTTAASIERTTPIVPMKLHDPRNSAICLEVWRPAPTRARTVRGGEIHDQDFFEPEIAGGRGETDGIHGAPSSSVAMSTVLDDGALPSRGVESEVLTLGAALMTRQPLRRWHR
jgi:hypothetical protein